MHLRDYQKASVDSLIDYWLSGGGNGLIVLPTGAGKSLVAAELLYRLWRDYDARPALVTHVSELVSQNARKLAEMHGDAPFGIYHAGLKRRDGKAPILFAGIQSVHRNPDVIGTREVIIVDEAHLLSHRDTGMYRKLINHMREREPEMRVGGLTATPFRLTTGRLDEDYGQHKALFDSVVYEEPITRMIERGFLVPLIPYVSPTKIDLSDVRKTGGDYNQGDLQDALDRQEINERIVDEIVVAGKERNTWLVFAAGVDHAHHLTDLLRQRGITAECVTGETSEPEKQRIYARAREGILRCLVGMNVFTTGLDIPSIDLIACVRPTASLGLWIQMLGRGTRLSPETDKENCLVLDFTQNSLELGPIDQARGAKNAPTQKGEAPMRECPACHHVHHISLLKCPECHHEYPPHDVKYIGQSRAAAILSTFKEPTWFDLDQKPVVRRHQSFGKPDSIRVDYVAGMMTFSHWLALDNPKGQKLAQRWWKNNSYSGMPPESVEEALERKDDIRAPGRILVMKDGKYNRITSFDYSIPLIEELVNG